MKFQLLFCIVLAVVAIFITPETKAAPSSKEHEKHQLLTVSNIKLWSQQLGQFIQNGKRHEQKRSITSFEMMKRNSNSNTRAIENPALLALFNYLTWMSELDTEAHYYQIGQLIQEILYSFSNFDDYLYGALTSVGVDVNALYVEYYEGLRNETRAFERNSHAFWKKWIDDPEHIPEHLLVFIPQIQQYLSFFATRTFNYYMNLVNLSNFLLSPDALKQLLSEVQVFLDEIAATIDQLKASFHPPTEIPPPATNLTLEGFLHFLPYLGELNVSSIILDGLSTARQLKDLRLTFDKDLVTLFGEASRDGANLDSDLASQGREITETFEAAAEDQYVMNRRALDKLVYACLYGGPWEDFVALNELLSIYLTGFYVIPPLAVETIVQLEGLVETLSPEFQQRASELVSLALKNADTLIQNYLETFKPKEKKN